MVNDLLILGASAGAHDIIDIVEAINEKRKQWNIVGFLDDTFPNRKSFLEYEILGPILLARASHRCFVINAIGSEHTFRERQAIIESIEQSSSRFATLIHPSAAISQRTVICHGTYVSAHACISGDCKIGTHTSICPNVIIGHDCSISSYSILAPGALLCGNVKIETSCYLGARSVVKQNLVVKHNALVGMGAVVTRNVEANEIVIGSPARGYKQSIHCT